MLKNLIGQGIESEHLLLGIIKDKECMAMTVLEESWRRFCRD